MLTQTYVCRACHQGKRRAHSDAAPPTCCDQPMKWVRTSTYTPPPQRFGQAPAIDFRNTSPLILPIGDGVAVESLREIRKLEQESEKMAADGLGQPLRVRGYSQDRGNMAVNTFGEPEQEKPDLTRTHKDGTPRVSITRNVLPEDADAADLGPGATEEHASALGLDP